MAFDWKHVDGGSHQAAAAVEDADNITREGYRVRHRLQVRFRDCDPIGHVNNAVYLTYCEQARIAYWRQVARAVENVPRSFIIARIECDYRSPALPGEALDVWVRVESIGRSSFPMTYEIVSANDGRVVATARTVQVMFDYAAHKPFPVPDALVGALERFEGRTLRAV